MLSERQVWNSNKPFEGRAAARVPGRMPWPKEYFRVADVIDRRSALAPPKRRALVDNTLTVNLENGKRILRAHGPSHE